MINLRILKWGVYPGLCRPHVITGVLITEGGRQEMREADVKRCQKNRGQRDTSARFEDGRGSSAKNEGLGKLEWQRNRFSSRDDVFTK